MGKKVFAAACSLAFVLCMSFFAYGEYSGLFLQDNTAAMQLVDRYVSKLMQNYTDGNMTISFKGIVKQGCDFWYYNDYNAKLIAANRSAGISPIVSTADYSIEYDDITYSNRQYVVNATITESFVYADDEQTDVVTKHRITIEQNGSEMLIIDDEVTSQEQSGDEPLNAYSGGETADTPEAAKRK